MKGDFQTLLRRFCLNTSILGLKYFYLYPDPISRCFWTLAMVIVLYLSFLLTRLLYSRFEEMPTRIAIENQYASVYNLSFPAITICLPNQITIAAMRHFNRTLVDGNRTLDLKSILPQLLGFYELLSNVNHDGLQSLQSLIELNRYHALEVVGMMPQTCDDFFKLCYFEQKKYPLCKGLFKPILTKHGMCCIFNGLYYYKNNRRNERATDFIPHRVTRVGLSQALTVVTDFEPDSALDSTIFNAGANRVMFTDWREFPADDESNLVHPHTESFHVIRPVYTYCSEDVISLPSWSRKCYFEDEYSLPYFKQYHNSDCDLLCLVHELERRCHCTMGYVPGVRLSRACNVTSIECIVQTKLQMSKWYRWEQCDCPRDCVSHYYRSDMTIGNLDALPDMFIDSYSDIVFNHSTSIMHFFFLNSVYVKQKQETVMSLISLSSNLGGVFGLCLGCSVISVLEIIFFIYLIVRNKIRDHLQTASRNKVTYLN